MDANSSEALGPTRTRQSSNQNNVILHLVF